MTADIAQTAIPEDYKFSSADSCFGTVTKHYTLSMSEEIRIGDLYGDETDQLEDPDAEPKKAAGGGK